jgi:hypothetical protein
MSEPKNIKEFIALVKRYETITLEEIEKVANIVEEHWMICRTCTGFGSVTTCTLCLVVNSDLSWNNCDDCVYESKACCEKGINYFSYEAISEADTPEELLTAYRARAAHLRLTYPQYFNEQTS